MRDRLIWCGIVTAVTLPLLLIAPSSHGEWYVGLYGGYSNPTKLRDVQMPMLGQQEAQASFPAYNPLVGDQLTSSLSTSDVALKSSGIFGGKAGYYFKDEGFSWLGVEVEAFTTTPTIKQQTVTSTLDATFVPKNINTTIVPPIVPTSIQQSGPLQLEESRMRMITVAFNVVARYPGEIFQPYVGAGVGAFYFSSSGQIDGHQVVPGVNLLGGLRLLITEEFGFFLEGKYNRATFTNLDPNFGLSGEYSAFHGVAGLSYHF
ncbi:MAG TPA: hypothetical protein PKA61_15575 [Nitrospira sp.]|nr:hypothetical protein [Nitrospira sp.]